ncbi:MAG: hypothetical protein GXP63_03970 [DPANN group archaeon]|nr:hypothetical protein [DPANN group archaeon]
MKRVAKDVRNGILMGLGALSLTVKEVNRSISKLSKRSGLTREEARKLSRRLLTEGQKEQERLTKIVDRELDRLLRSLERRRKAANPAPKKKMPKKKKMQPRPRAAKRTEKKSLRKRR